MIYGINLVYNFSKTPLPHPSLLDERIAFFVEIESTFLGVVYTLVFYRGIFFFLVGREVSLSMVINFLISFLYYTFNIL